jgi:hypothetical protein
MAHRLRLHRRLGVMPALVHVAAKETRLIPHTSRGTLAEAPGGAWQSPQDDARRALLLRRIPG